MVLIDHLHLFHQKKSLFLQRKNFFFPNTTLSNDPIIFDLNDLTLSTVDGQTINVDLKKTAELEKAMPETSTLKAWALLDGQVVFTLPGNVQLETITYNHNNEKTVKKYFPQ